LQLHAFETSFEEIVEGVAEATEERKEGEPRVRYRLSLISQFLEGDELKEIWLYSPRDEERRKEMEMFGFGADGPGGGGGGGGGGGYDDRRGGGGRY